ncbi:hypothetical protein J2T21_000258 [Paeniglutamicibacter psychrophenolicus]|nr:hypothetical protein [Paeniglutamicibacter psychrophenolicus]
MGKFPPAVVSSIETTIPRLSLAGLRHKGDCRGTADRGRSHAIRRLPGSNAGHPAMAVHGAQGPRASGRLGETTGHQIPPCFRSRAQMAAKMRRAVPRQPD